MNFHRLSQNEHQVILKHGLLLEVTYVDEVWEYDKTTRFD